MRKHRSLVFTALLVVLLISLFLVPPGWASHITSPFVSGLRYVQSFYLNIINRKTVPSQSEFKSLKDERDSLREEVILLREENYKLRYMLDIRQNILKDFRQVLPAQVVQTYLGRGERTYLIQGGTDKGFRENYVVVSSEGLVGQITGTTSHFSQVLLIIDRNSSLPALVQKTRLQGIIYGTGGLNELYMELDGPAEDVDKGDMVVTSGMGVIFPAGILIGFVEEVLPDRYGLPQRILISPAVDFRRLEIVGVTPQKAEHEVF